MKNEKDVVIVIATHREYWMPEDAMYLPLHVGAEGKTDEKGNPLDLGYTKDNSGENISEKNGLYCELTGMYWAWKNLDSDYIGLAHYRRHFASSKRIGNNYNRVLNGDELQKYIGKYRVFVPKKRYYVIESLYSHYEHTHYIEQLDCTRKIISQMFPDYLSVFDKVIRRTSGYMFNMFIMERELFCSYCEWLFPILFELEKHTDTSHLSSFQQRYIGRVSEILYNVWLEYQLDNNVLKKNEMKTLPYVFLGKIKRRKKVIAFLKAKFMKEKYTESF